MHSEATGDQESETRWLLDSLEDAVANQPFDNLGLYVIQVPQPQAAAHEAAVSDRGTPYRFGVEIQALPTVDLGGEPNAELEHLADSQLILAEQQQAILRDISKETHLLPGVPVVHGERAVRHGAMVVAMVKHDLILP